MERSGRLFISLFAVLMTAQQIVAEEWRGIVPLVSTRADVISLLGECSGKEPVCEFTIPNEEILIVFSTSDTCPQLAAGTVLFVERELQTAKTLAALGFERKRFETFDPSWPRNIGYRGYEDKHSGLLLKSYKGEIFQIDHIAAKRDRFRCPGYYRRPRDFVQAVPEHAPLVSIRCPENNPSAGERIAFVANYQRSGLRIFLEWHASGGRIVEGQKTRQILLDTTGLEGQTIEVSVERADTLHNVSFTSCKVQISSAKKV